jgi:hypothetical protein
MAEADRRVGEGEDLGAGPPAQGEDLQRRAVEEVGQGTAPEALLVADVGRKDVDQVGGALGRGAAVGGREALAVGSREFLDRGRQVPDGEAPGNPPGQVEVVELEHEALA